MKDIPTAVLMVFIINAFVVLGIVLGIVFWQPQWFVSEKCGDTEFIKYEVLEGIDESDSWITTISWEGKHYVIFRPIKQCLSDQGSSYIINSQCAN